MHFNPVRIYRRARLNIGLKLGLGIGAMWLAMMGVGTSAHAAEVVTHWEMPDIASPEADRPYQPNIFGTIALPLSSLPTGTRWSKLMIASIAQPALASLTESARELPPQEQLAFVQGAVNRAVRTQAVTNDCSDDGYWAPASETLSRGMGDCFDIAIAKMEALRFLGIPNKDMFLTTGRFHTAAETGKGRQSAALLVRIGDHFSLLTEQSEPVIEDNNAPEGIATFTPILTYGVGMTWLHGRLVRLAALGL